MVDSSSQIISDPGGYVTQPDSPAASPAQIVVVNPPATVSNPWAQPTAYRPPTDQWIGPEIHPAGKYSTGHSQYGPAVVSPSGTPRYVQGPVLSPTPVEPVGNTGV